MDSSVIMCIVLGLCLTGMSFFLGMVVGANLLLSRLTRMIRSASADISKVIKDMPNKF